MGAAMIIKLPGKTKDPWRHTDWHRWFAWHPVFLGERKDGFLVGGQPREVAWLQYVERKGSATHGNEMPQYRRIT